MRFCWDPPIETGEKGRKMYGKKKKKIEYF